MPKPLIGIIGITELLAKRGWNMDVHLAYAEAISKAGGLPFIIPNLLDADAGLMLTYLERIDGLMSTGGPDIDPNIYGQGTHPALTRMDKARDAFALPLIKAAIAESLLPFLGICRGCQELNVALGGTLHLDIPSIEGRTSAINHSETEDRHVAAHEIEIVEGTMLRRIAGTNRVGVTSRHHQAVKELGHGLRVSAIANDGIIEAIELPSHPFCLGVQGHPEDQRDSDFPDELFGAFVAAAAAYAKLH